MRNDPRQDAISSRSRISPALFRMAMIAIALMGFALDAAADPKSKPAVLSGHEIVFASSGDPSLAQLQSARAECPFGTGVIAGGFSLSTSGVEAYSLVSNYPADGYTVQEPGGPPIEFNNGWLVQVLRTDGQLTNWGFRPTRSVSPSSEVRARQRRSLGVA